MDNEFGTLKNLMADNGLTGGGVLPSIDSFLKWLDKLICGSTDACAIGCETCSGACSGSCISCQTGS